MAHGRDGSNLEDAEVSSLPTRIVAIAVLKDMLAEADTALRAEILAQMLPGDRQSAVVYNAAGDGVQVGSITRKKLEPGGQPTAAVNDLDALVAWCQKYAPSEVQMIVTVRPAFQKRLLDVVKTHGAWVSPITGEVLIPDGLELSATGPSGGGLMVTKTDDGPDLIRAEIAAGRLTFADVLAIEAGAA